eukprot:TRINITY_DN20217_c1_g1_i5.p2 TRINITY_DN20217_c1_g1~~TRINITY_DN20217_c1_g1_i5.p2  ORF type:complete len:145 (+),score=2.98 TRINITY_DN20217_c1_g1_i5:304-738(+)
MEIKVVQFNGKKKGEYHNFFFIDSVTTSSTKFQIQVFIISKTLQQQHNIPIQQQQRQQQYQQYSNIYNTIIILLQNPQEINTKNDTQQINQCPKDKIPQKQRQNILYIIQVQIQKHQRKKKNLKKLQSDFSMIFTPKRMKKGTN